MTGAQRLMRVAVALILLVMIAPIVVVVLLSFSSANYLTFPPPAFGLRWYHAYLASRDWLAATWLSIEVAISVVALSTVLGTLAALGLARLPWVARMLATGLILSPLIMPVIIVAIGLSHYAFARFGLVGTPLGLVLAHTCLAVPFVVTSVGASLARFDRRLEMAALGLGATPWGTFRQVTLPLILPRRAGGRALRIHYVIRRTGRVAVPVWRERGDAAATDVGGSQVCTGSDDRRCFDADDRRDGSAVALGALVLQASIRRRARHARDRLARRHRIQCCVLTPR